MILYNTLIELLDPDLQDCHATWTRQATLNRACQASNELWYTTYLYILRSTRKELEVPQERRHESEDESVFLVDMRASVAEDKSSTLVTPDSL